MRDFFDTNTFRHNTVGIAPALIGSGMSLAGGIFSGMSQNKAMKKAQRSANIQTGRNVFNQLAINQALQKKARSEADLQDLGRVDSSFGGSQGGFMFGEEFLTQAQARERGLIREDTDMVMIAQPGTNAFMPITRTKVDPRLTKTTRTRLSPELESIRQQALGFQGTAGEALQAGFQDIDVSGDAGRELELLNQLAAPREAERREQLFGMLQRTGQLGSTGGANIFRGAEEAIAREGLKRELSARDIARSERDRRFAANVDLFGLGNQTTSNLFNIEQGLTNRLLATSRGGRQIPMPGVNLAGLRESPANFMGSGFNTGSAVGAFLGGLGQQVAAGGIDFGGLFGGRGGATGGQDFMTDTLLPPSGSRSDLLFGRF